MVVSLTWASTSGAVQVADPVDHHTIAANSAGVVSNLYVRHDGVNKITNCSWLIQPYTGSGYAGLNGQIADYNEIVGWGDVYYAGGAWTGTKGGFIINQDAAGSFPVGSDDYIYTDHGTTGHGIQLSALSTSTSAAGEINAGDESHIQVNIFVPSGASSGLRFIDQRLTYDYTS